MRQVEIVRRQITGQRPLEQQLITLEAVLAREVNSLHKARKINDDAMADVCWRSMVMLP